MKTLIFYDNNGQIFTQITGEYLIPVGLQHMEIELIQGKQVTGVDVSVTPHQVILEDIPKSEMDLIKEELQAAQQAIDFLIMGGM